MPGQVASGSQLKVVLSGSVKNSSGHSNGTGVVGDIVFRKAGEVSSEGATGSSGSTGSAGSSPQQDVEQGVGGKRLPASLAFIPCVIAFKDIKYHVPKPGAKVRCVGVCGRC